MHTLSALQDERLAAVVRHVHNHTGTAAQWSHLMKTNPGTGVAIIVICAVLILIAFATTRSRTN